MDYVLAITTSLSFGVVVGFIVGAFKMARKPVYTEKQIERTRVVQKKYAAAAKYVTFFVLGQGLIWCAYFLILGVVDPASVDYATGMSQLIVSVLTVVSIIFAFFEFLRRK